MNTYAYQKGVAARDLGRARMTNPFSPESDEHQAWDDGWSMLERLLVLVAQGGPSHG